MFSMDGFLFCCQTAEPFVQVQQTLGTFPLCRRLVAGAALFHPATKHYVSTFVNNSTATTVLYNIAMFVKRSACTIPKFRGMQELSLYTRLLCLEAKRCASITMIGTEFDVFSTSIRYRISVAACRDIQFLSDNYTN